MNESKIIVLYAYRLLLREWRRFVLPFGSFIITAIVLSVTLALTSSGNRLLAEQSREILGGDVVLEQTTPIPTAEFWQAVGGTPTIVSEQIEFTGTLAHGSTTSGFSIDVVDASFPVYGELVITTGNYQGLRDDELLLDRAGADRLGVAQGDVVYFNEQPYTVAGIIVKEPTALFGGFRFLPRAIMSDAGFIRSTVDARLLRAEYRSAARFEQTTPAELRRMKEEGEQRYPGIDVDIAGVNTNGTRFGLETVSDFLVITVVMTAVLAAVNVYASTLFLVTVERKSLAIWMALGMRRRTVVSIVASAILYVVLAAGLVGSFVGLGVFSLIATYAREVAAVALPTPTFFFIVASSVTLLVMVAAASVFPVLRQLLTLRPRQLLAEDSEEERPRFASVVILTISTLVPLAIFASILLESLVDGLVVIVLVAAAYTAIALGVAAVFRFLYRVRDRYPFLLRTIIAQKKADGLFGVVATTSLFVALTTLGSLAFLQTGVERFLIEDLATTVPTTYVIDVQPSQKDRLLEIYPDVALFDNVGARLAMIDGLDIAEAIARQDETVDRELGREFNITARDTLLENEQIVAGRWHDGTPGEVSVDEGFAKRASIELGSEITFTIQGFPVTAIVTSLRETDSRSGLPFFYFVLAPEDIAAFPRIYFGYANYNETEQQALGQFVASEMPNVTMIETQTLGALIISLVRTLLLVIFLVTLPPLLIATLLIATLVVSSFAARRRDGARMRTLGATLRAVERGYILESVSLTFVAALLAYVASIIVAWSVSWFVLDFSDVVLFAPVVLVGLGAIMVMVTMLAFLLFRTDRAPLRTLLSYDHQ